MPNLLETTDISNYTLTSSFVNNTEVLAFSIDIPEDFLAVNIGLHVRSQIGGARTIQTAIYSSKGVLPAALPDELIIDLGTTPVSSSSFSNVSLSGANTFEGKAGIYWVCITTDSGFGNGIQAKTSLVQPAGTTEPKIVDGILLFGSAWPTVFPFNLQTNLYGYAFVNIDIISVAFLAKDRSNVLRLIYGDDPTSPDDKNVLDISGLVIDDNIFLKVGGLAHNPGTETIVKQGKSAYRDGSTRVHSNRANSIFQITVDVCGGSTTHLSKILSDIDEFWLKNKTNKEKLEGEKIWLEYRWADKLKSVPAPVWGQLSTYLELEKFGKTQGSQIQSGALAVGNIENIVLQFEGAPYPEGAPQKVGFAQGFVEPNNNGVLIGQGRVGHNLFANPSFASAVAFDNGWSASTDLLVIQETRDNYTRSFNSAVRLISQDGAVLQSLSESVTLTLGNDYWMSAKVRMPDGSAPTETEMQLFVDIGVILTTTFVKIDNTVWYLAYGNGITVTDSGGGLSTAPRGIINNNGSTFIVDDVLISDRTVADEGSRTLPPTFISGDSLGGNWTGTRHDSTTDSDSGRIIVQFDDEMAGHWTVSGWATFEWDTRVILPGPIPLFTYSIDPDNFVQLSYPTGTDIGVDRKLLGNLKFISNLFVPPGFGVPTHYCMTQDATTLSLYVNGGLIGFNSDAKGALGPGGLFTIGYDGGVDNAADATFDAVRVFDVALSAAQIKQFYDNELFIKNKFKRVGIPPFLWTNGTGTSILGQVTTTTPHACMAVTGNVEAEVIWKFDLANTVNRRRVFWFGRKATDRLFDFASFIQVTGMPLTAIMPTLTEDTEVSIPFIDIPAAKGHWLIQGSFDVKDNPVSTKSFFRLGTSDRIFGDDLELGITPAAPNELHYQSGNWDKVINWPDSQGVPTNLNVGWRFTNNAAGSTSVLGFTVIMIPQPAIRFETEAVANPTANIITLDSKEAYISDSTGLQLHRYETRGQSVTLDPLKLNMCILVMAEEDEVAEAQDIRVSAKYTPRWLTFGGAVG